ncbi:inosine/xanthosine triphosphatase [Halorubrum gandharaense]
MRIGVGSGNPVKRRAVERVLDDGEDAFAAEATVEAVPVPSGVSEQPRGHAETIMGAENRARAVLAESDGVYDLGVGVEGGVAELDGMDGLSLVMWAAVDDGECVGRGAGPSMRLPDSIAERVNAGEELGPVMDDVLGTQGVATRGGAAGALTGGRVGRAEALSTAVAGALGPFVSKLY